MELTDIKWTQWDKILKAHNAGKVIDKRDIHRALDDDAMMFESAKEVFRKIVDNEIELKRGIKQHWLIDYVQHHPATGRLIREVLSDLVDMEVEAIRESGLKLRGTDGPKREALERIAKLHGMSRSSLEQKILKPPNK